MATQSRLRSVLLNLNPLWLWGAMCAWAYAFFPPFTIPDWVTVYSLAGLVVLVQRLSIQVTEEESFYLEAAFFIGFALEYPVHLLVWAGLLYAAFTSLRYRRRWHVQAVNGALTTLAALCAREVASLLPGGDPARALPSVAVIAVFAGTFFAVNLGLTTLHMMVHFGKQGIAMTRQALTWRFYIIFAVEILIGVLLAAVLHDAGLTGAILFTGLVLLVGYSFQDYFKMAHHFKELSVRDALTGLHNHRWINSLMDELFADKQMFALMMLDIDHFKRYNEAWGHVQGDEVLKQIAGILDETHGLEHDVSRFSGEEFAVVMRDCELAAALERAEVIRGKVEQAQIKGVDALPGKRLTVSIGIAHYPSMAESKTDLLMMVDDALYKGKMTGYNKVSIYTSVIDEIRKNVNLTEDDEEIFRTIKVFLAILNSKDRYTYAHTERDVRYVEALAKKMALDEVQWRALRFGAFLHDIGKVDVPMEVLAKRGPLNKEEWVLMRNHVEIGVTIMKPIQPLEPSIPIVRHHHERFDGGGYPDGIAGEDIPLGARMLTLADSFDAMTTSRPYQRKRSMQEAFAELRDCSGSQFDPALVEPFIEVVKDIGLLMEDGDQVLA